MNKKITQPIPLAIFTSFLLMLISGMMVSCNQQTTTKSDLFNQIFIDDTSTFRKTNLRDPIQLALANEAPNKPQHNDKLGLMYEYELSPSCKMIIDYYTDNLTSDSRTDKISSIVANILLNDEVETSRMFSEILEHFNHYYGISSGVYGNYSWETATKYTTNMEVRLILDDSKKGITINYIDIQPEAHTDTGSTDIASEPIE